jgi:serine/threonine protein kinase
MKVNFNNIKIIKKLGIGFSGTTYLVLYKKKKYALKIQHIFDTNIKNKKSDLWNEINFIKYVNKYPITFRHTYDYNIIHNCNFVKNNKSIGLNVYNNSGEYKRLQQSKLCIQYITDYQKNILYKIIDKLNIKQIYSLILQYSYTILLMHKNNYIHGDIHNGNIGYVKTNKKYIKILDNKIPTFGYIFKIIEA